MVTICSTSLTFNNSTFCPHSEIMCFVWISKQTELFPYTTLTDWFYNIDLTRYRLFVTICTTILTLPNSTFCPHSEFLCFLWIAEQTEIFPYTILTDWFYNIDLKLYRAVVTIYTTSLTFNISTFCPHIEVMFFVWISEQTEIFPHMSLTDWNYKIDLTLY